MSDKVVSLIGGMAISLLLASGSVMAQERADVQERIKPIGQVNVAAAAAPAPVVAEPAAVTPPPVAEPMPEPQMAAETTAPAATVAQAPAGGGAELYATKGCPLCHGGDARSPIMSTYPKLAGLAEVYLFNQLKDIKSGARNNGQSAVMLGVLASLSEAEMAEIAAWLSSQ